MPGKQKVRRIAASGSVGLLLAIGAGTVAEAMGGMGGPSDAWGSQYVLIAPQSFPGATSANRGQSELTPVDRRPPTTRARASKGKGKARPKRGPA